MEGKSILNCVVKEGHIKDVTVKLKSNEKKKPAMPTSGEWGPGENRKVECTGPKKEHSGHLRNTHIRMSAARHPRILGAKVRNLD